MRTVVGVGVAGAPGVDVVAGLDLRPLHPVRQQTHVVSSRLGLPSRRAGLCSQPLRLASSSSSASPATGRARPWSQRCGVTHMDRGGRGDRTLLDAGEKVSRAV